MSELEVDGRIHVTQGEATITFRGPGRLVMPDRAVGTCLCLLSDPPQFQFQVAEGESVRFTPEKSSADLASENGQNCDDTSTNS